MKTFVLCSKPHGCCCEVRIEADEIKISDDYMNEVTMTREEFEIMIEKYERGEFF